MSRQTVGVVVPAAGRGARFGSGENKIWALVGGRPIIAHTLAALSVTDDVGPIVVVASAGEVERVADLAGQFGKVVCVVPGGATRSESVLEGLQALPGEVQTVLVHDAARPFVSADLVRRVVDGVVAYGACVPALPITDTVKSVSPVGGITGTLDRSQLRTVQTPQGARLSMLMGAYGHLGERAALATDEAGLLEMAGHSVHTVEGDRDNLKVTEPGDLARARARYSATRERRTGFGYDVHTLVENRDLWLGGVLVPHSRGLLGHSDADVLIHAVCDAILGAACLGDIGRLFPDTDPAHQDRPSLEFLREVRDRIALDGWRVVHVDVALAAEAPKVSPHRAAMAGAMATALDTTPGIINIKATTNEGMGFVGRAEGIACWAVATIERRGDEDCL